MSCLCYLPSVFTLPQLIGIGIIIAVDTLLVVFVTIVNALQQSFAVIVIVGYYGISVLVAKQATLDFALSVVVEQQTDITLAFLCEYRLGAPSVHIPVLPILLYQIEVVLVGLRRGSTTHCERCLVTAKAKGLLFGDTSLYRESK